MSREVLLIRQLEGMVGRCQSSFLLTRSHEALKRLALFRRENLGLSFGLLNLEFELFLHLLKFLEFGTRAAVLFIRSA